MQVWERFKTTYCRRDRRADEQSEQDSLRENLKPSFQKDLTNPFLHDTRKEVAERQSVVFAKLTTLFFCGSFDQTLKFGPPHGAWMIVRRQAQDYESRIDQVCLSKESGRMQ